jgi:hypothetical protein
MNSLPEAIAKQLPQEVAQILSILDQIEEHTNIVRKKLLSELKA